MIHKLARLFTEQAYKALIEKESFDEHILHDEVEQVTMEMNELEKKLETKRQQLAEVNADLAAMETSETYSKTLHQFQMEQEQLKKSTADWAGRKTAKTGRASRRER